MTEVKTSSMIAMIADILKLENIFSIRQLKAYRKLIMSQPPP